MTVTVRPCVGVRVAAGLLLVSVLSAGTAEGTSEARAEHHAHIRSETIAGLIAGMKFHFTNSGVDLRDAGHVATLQRVFRSLEHAGYRWSFTCERSGTITARLIRACSSGMS